MIHLKQAMNDAGLNNPRLAKLIGCAPVEIWRLVTWPEKGGCKMTPEWATKIAPHLGVNPQELLFEITKTDNDLEIENLKKEIEKLKKVIIDLLD
jgi:plasmid maintenance system antidote protein VapI